MPLAILENIHLAFGHVALLDNAGFVIDVNQRIGLIGRNGTGKSSLLKVLALEIKPDEGNVWISPDCVVSYVPQEPVLNPDDTIYECVAEGFGNVKNLLIEYHNLLNHLDNDENLKRLEEIQHELETLNAWQLQSQVEATLTRLNLSADTKVSTLSGGQRKKVAIARCLVTSPDLILLDEPTNHLDIETIEWLEEMLLSYKGSLLFITHDRHFLDRLCNKIYELDRGKITEFPGSFEQYQLKKAEMLQAENVQNAKFDKFLAQEEVWIRKGIEARRTRNEGRVRRLESLRTERAMRRDRLGQVSFSIDSGEKSGQVIAELHQVSFQYGEKSIIQNFSTRLMRGDKVGLIGPNGIGKSTLLKLILGELTPTSGSIKQGTRLTVAYFDQLRQQLNPEATLAETVSTSTDFVEINGNRKHVIGYLEEFLFAPERSRSPVKSLSGGERNRLLLAKLFTQPSNVLVLDEPTNDLDIDTLELLEQLLQDYQGTVFLVSHDRQFLDNLVTQSIVFEGNGILKEYPGGYTDWKAQLKNAEALQNKNATESKNKVQMQDDSKNKTSTQKNNNRAVKLSYNEVRELNSLPDVISGLEKEQALIQQHIIDLSSKGSLSPTEIDDLKNFQLKIDELDNLLIEKMERWEFLEQKQNGILNNE